MAMVNICVIEFNVLYKHFKKIVKKLMKLRGEKNSEEN